MNPICRGGNCDEVAHWVYEVIKELALQTDKTEPLINLISTYDPKVWTVYLFPRSKHRPAYASRQRSTTWDH